MPFIRGEFGLNSWGGFTVTDGSKTETGIGDKGFAVFKFVDLAEILIINTMFRKQKFNK